MLEFKAKLQKSILLGEISKVKEIVDSTKFVISVNDEILIATLNNNFEIVSLLKNQYYNNTTTLITIAHFNGNQELIKLFLQKEMTEEGVQECVHYFNEPIEKLQLIIKEKNIEFPLYKKESNTSDLIFEPFYF